MAIQQQGAVKTRTIALTATAIPVGFTTTALTGTWTSAQLGTSGTYLLTGVGGAAIAEILKGTSVNTYPTADASPAPQQPQPTFPFFGWVYMNGLLATVLGVRGNNAIVVNSDLGASASSISAVTTLYNAPSNIKVYNVGGTAGTVVVTHPDDVAATITLYSSPFVLDGKDGVLNPVLIKLGTAASGNAVITY